MNHRVAKNLMAITAAYSDQYTLVASPLSYFPVSGYPASTKTVVFFYSSPTALTAGAAEIESYKSAGARFIAVYLASDSFTQTATSSLSRQDLFTPSLSEASFPNRDLSLAQTRMLPALFRTIFKFPGYACSVSGTGNIVTFDGSYYAMANAGVHYLVKSAGFNVLGLFVPCGGAFSCLRGVHVSSRGGSFAFKWISGEVQVLENGEYKPAAGYSKSTGDSYVNLMREVKNGMKGEDVFRFSVCVNYGLSCVEGVLGVMSRVQITSATVGTTGLCGYYDGCGCNDFVFQTKQLATCEPGVAAEMIATSGMGLTRSWVTLATSTSGLKTPDLRSDDGRREFIDFVDSWREPKSLDFKLTRDFSSWLRHIQETRPEDGTGLQDVVLPTTAPENPAADCARLPSNYSRAMCERDVRLTKDSAFARLTQEAVFDSCTLYCLSGGHVPDPLLFSNGSYCDMHVCQPHVDFITPATVPSSWVDWSSRLFQTYNNSNMPPSSLMSTTSAESGMTPQHGFGGTYTTSLKVTTSCSTTPYEFNTTVKIICRKVNLSVTTVPFANPIAFSKTWGYGVLSLVANFSAHSMFAESDLIMTSWKLVSAPASYDLTLHPRYVLRPKASRLLWFTKAAVPGDYVWQALISDGCYKVRASLSINLGCSRCAPLVRISGTSNSVIWSGASSFPPVTVWLKYSDPDSSIVPAKFDLTTVSPAASGRPLELLSSSNSSSLYVWSFGRKAVTADPTVWCSQNYSTTLTSTNPATSAPYGTFAFNASFPHQILETGFVISTATVNVLNTTNCTRINPSIPDQVVCNVTYTPGDSVLRFSHTSHPLDCVSTFRFSIFGADECQTDSDVVPIVVSCGVRPIAQPLCPSVVRYNYLDGTFTAATPNVGWNLWGGNGQNWATVQMNAAESHHTSTSRNTKLKWTLVEEPTHPFFGSTWGTFPGATTNAIRTFVPSFGGRYVFNLTVDDGCQNETAMKVITAECKDPISFAYTQIESTTTTVTNPTVITTSSTPSFTVPHNSVSGYVSWKIDAFNTRYWWEAQNTSFTWLFQLGVPPRDANDWLDQTPTISGASNILIPWSIASFNTTSITWPQTIRPGAYNLTLHVTDHCTYATQMLKWTVACATTQMNIDLSQTTLSATELVVNTSGSTVTPADSVLLWRTPGFGSPSSSTTTPRTWTFSGSFAGTLNITVYVRAGNCFFASKSILKTICGLTSSISLDVTTWNTGNTGGIWINTTGSTAAATFSYYVRRTSGGDWFPLTLDGSGKFYPQNDLSFFTAGSYTVLQNVSATGCPAATATTTFTVDCLGGLSTLQLTSTPVAAANWVITSTWSPYKWTAVQFHANNSIFLGGRHASASVWISVWGAPDNSVWAPKVVTTPLIPTTLWSNWTAPNGTAMESWVVAASGALTTKTYRKFLRSAAAVEGSATRELLGSSCFHPDVPGTYNLYAQITDGCTTPFMTNITVLANCLPITGSFSPAPSSYSRTLAKPYTLTLDATGVVSGYNTPMTYQWTVSRPLTLPASNFTTYSMSSAELTTCDAAWSDPAGPDASYGNNVHVSQTIRPSVANAAVSVTFTDFDLQFLHDGPCNDYLQVFNGPSTSSTPLTNFQCGLSIPTTYTSTDPSGALTFLFHTDSSTVANGWRAMIACKSVESVSTYALAERTSQVARLTMWLPAVYEVTLVVSDGCSTQSIVQSYSLTCEADSSVSTYTTQVVERTYQYIGPLNEIFAPLQLPIADTLFACADSFQWSVVDYSEAVESQLVEGVAPVATPQEEILYLGAAPKDKWRDTLEGERGLAAIVILGVFFVVFLIAGLIIIGAIAAGKAAAKTSPSPAGAKAVP